MRSRCRRSFLLVAVLLCGMSVVQAAPQTSIGGVERFTDIGNNAARWQQGTLFADQNGFVPLTNVDLSLNNLGLTPEVLAAISGKVVMTLNLWLQFSNSLNISNFKRSAETYTIDGVPYILVSVKGSVPPKPIGIDDEVLKLNTSGIAYCAGIKPRKFNSQNDVDLWLHIDNDSSAILYGDEALTDTVATLSLETSAIAKNQTSFIAFSGDVDQQITILGTFTLDAAGIIKSVKATLIQNKTIDPCFSQASVNGKRIIRR